MANAFALLLQQREMAAAEIADERKAAEALQHSPQEKSSCGFANTHHRARWHD